MKKIYLLMAALVFGNTYAQDCQNTDPASATGSQGCVTFTYKGNTVQYTTVRAADGNIWLQQNLGSAAIAASATDENGYGDLFQWGRWDDGHQSRTSETVGTPPSPNNPEGIPGGYAKFYTSEPRWWAGSASSDTWEAATPAQVSATNGCDPCKALGAGWHMPAAAEWETVKNSEQITNVATAYSSNLKLPVAGSRDVSGSMNFTGVRGYYWSKDASPTNALYSKYFYYSNAVVNTNAGGFRAQGSAVRCLKNAVPATMGILINVLNNGLAQITTSGGTLELQAQVTPVTAGQGVSWSVVSGNTFATVSSTGLVTAIANGTVIIQAASTENPAVTNTISITISGQVSAAPYCGVSVDYDVEPISRVVFAGIDNTTSAVVNATPGYESFLNLTAQVNRGQTYTMQIEGNTVGLFSHDIRVFIDWNRNDVFDMDTEYYASAIENSTGTDGTQATLNITVPDNAVTGTTRLRIIKDMWNVYEPGEFDACLNAYYGQVEDYSVNISEAPLPASVVITTVNNELPEITTLNGTLQLQAQVLPAVTSQEVTWSVVAGSEFAAIDENGLVTATANGSITIQAASTVNPEITGTITINITGQVTLPQSIAITVQNNAPAVINVFEGTLQLQAAILPEGANQQVSWSIVSGGNVVSIHANGLVTAHADGIAVIQAVSTANPELIATITITVINQVPPVLAAPYCDIEVINTIEPVTQVTFAGINNTTSAVINGTPAYESFIGLTAEVTPGETYTLTVKGNTNGNTENTIRVYADWNRDNEFDNTNEYYTATLASSTGNDAVEAVLQITIPENAIPGITRLRIIKEAVTTGSPDACMVIQAGQAEDYSIQVNQPLYTPDYKKAGFIVYPNPVTNVLNIHSETVVSHVTVYNLTGQVIAGASGNKVSFDTIATGVYMVKVVFENGTSAMHKVIKK